MNQNEWREAVANKVVIPVFVPAKGSYMERLIDKGSGIVGTKRGDRIMAYYEGNRYGAENLNLFEERVRCAAGRLITEYPTVACAFVPEADLKEIGEFHCATGAVLITDTDAWEGWIN